MPIYTVKTGTLSDSTAENKRNLARKSNGDLWCTYHRSDGTAVQIYCAYSTDGGQTWTEEQVTNNLFGGYGQWYPAIAIDSADNIHVVWYGDGWGTDTWNLNIQYRKRTTSWQTQEAVTTDVTNDQIYPSIAIDSSNNVHVVWLGYGWGTNTNYANLQYRKRTTVWQDQEAITDMNDEQSFPSIAIDSSNNVHVIWFGRGWGTYTNRWNIQYRKRTTSWQTQEAVTDKNGWQWEPSIAIDSNNNVHVVWYGGETPSSIGNIQYRKRTTSWQTQEAVTDKNAEQYCPSIAIDVSNNVHVVWDGYGWGVNTSSDNIQYREKTTSWQTQVGITDRAYTQGYPSLIWASYPTVDGLKTNIPKTGYAFVWSGQDATGYNVEYFASDDLSWETARHHRHHPTIPTEPNRGKVLSEMGSL